MRAHKSSKSAIQHMLGVSPDQYSFLKTYYFMPSCNCSLGNECPIRKVILVLITTHINKTLLRSLGTGTSALLILFQLHSFLLL